MLVWFSMWTPESGAVSGRVIRSYSHHLGSEPREGAEQPPHFVQEFAHTRSFDFGSHLPEFQSQDCRAVLEPERLMRFRRSGS